MSKPVFEDIFKFTGRRNRKSYLLIQLSTWATTCISAFVGIIGLGMADEGGLALALGGILVLAGLVGFVGSIAAAWITSAQRCRDIGWPGWVCLVQLIPYVGFVAGLVIWIAPGDTLEDNKYGKSCISPQTV